MDYWHNLAFDQEQEDGAASSGQGQKETGTEPQQPAADAAPGSREDAGQTQ